ncbi:LuxR C-terminal-related transcriptional regulator [Streptomyces sp. NPDC059900]|uniref:helix-turn-helix transcriptional regulator n=1 Tax=Streptomyces sp. NPDC059900 TaxID=3155816 RepID=UPI0034416DB4
MSLSSLGVSEGEEDLYRHLLRNPATDMTPLDQVLGISREEMARSLESLCAKKLLRGGEGRPLTPIDPVIGVERLIEQRMGELNQELQRVAAARADIASLVEDARSGGLKQAEEPSDIERVEGLDEIRARLDDLAFFAHKEMLALQPDGVLSPGYIESARPLDLRCIRRGITMRYVVLRDGLEDAATSDYLHELAELGAEIKTVDTMMDRMVVYDREVAVVPMDPAASARGALVVRQAGLVSNMVAYFEKVWAAADDLPGRGPGDAADVLGPLERQVLETLSRVDKDEVAARQMGISIRTFRRHVAELLVKLGASNRFQAALMAKERGWM